MKAKKRAINTAMMRELRAEYSEAPEEIRDDLNLHRFKQSKEEKHRTEYEEDNYRRVVLTKEDKVSITCTCMVLAKTTTCSLPGVHSK